MRGALWLVPLFLTGCLSTSPPAPAAPPGSIVAYGDSYTEGHGTTMDMAYPARLSAALGRPVANRGITGETAREGLARFDSDVKAAKPSLVIIEFGVNEAYRGYPVSDSISAIDEAVVRSQSLGAKVIIVGVHFWSFQTNFDDGLRAIAAKRQTGLVLDVLHGIVSSQQRVDDGDPALRSDDFHPNAAGYSLMSKRIEPEVRRVLGS